MPFVCSVFAEGSGALRRTVPPSGFQILWVRDSSGSCEADDISCLRSTRSHLGWSHFPCPGYRLQPDASDASDGLIALSVRTMSQTALTALTILTIQESSCD